MTCNDKIWKERCRFRKINIKDMTEMVRASCDEKRRPRSGESAEKRQTRKKKNRTKENKAWTVTWVSSVKVYSSAITLTNRAHHAWATSNEGQMH